MFRLYHFSWARAPWNYSHPPVLMAMPIMRKSSDKIVITKGPGQYGDTQDDVAANPDCGTDRMQCEGESIHES